MRSELESRAQDVVALAKKAGATDAWARAGRSRSVSVKVRDGKLEEITDSTSRSVEVQLFVEGRYSRHSTTDLRPEPLSAFVTQAVKLTRALEVDAFRVMPDPTLFAGRPDAASLGIADAGVHAVTSAARLDAAMRINAAARADEKVISVTSEASDTHGITAAASSNGFVGSYEGTSFGSYGDVTLDDGDKRPEEWMGTWTRQSSDLWAPERIGAEALRLAKLRLGMKKGPTLRGFMLVDPRAAGRLVSQLLSPAWGNAIQQGRSFWRDSIGKKKVSEKLSIVDDPTLARGLASRPFNSEGAASKPMRVLTKGALENYYLDTYYAKKLGLSPTTADSGNQLVALGKRPLAGILRDVKDGVYVTSWLGGNMDATSGDFSYGARGHLISKGEIGGPIGEVNVTGNLLDLFSHLTEVGSDPWLFSGLQVPTLLFEGVQFSGT